MSTPEDSAADDPSNLPLALLVQPAAVDDIRRQVAYFQQEATPEVAHRFFQAVQASMNDLTPMPGMGATAENRILPDLRRWRVKGFENLLLFYRFNASTVSVIRVLHGMRDLDSILSDTWELHS